MALPKIYSAKLLEIRIEAGHALAHLHHDHMLDFRGAVRAALCNSFVMVEDSEVTTIGRYRQQVTIDFRVEL